MKRINLILILFIFLFIYFPPFSFTNTLHIIGFFSWIVIFLNSSLTISFKRMKKILYVFLTLIFLFLYLVVVTSVNLTEISFTFNLLYLIFDVLPSSIALTIIVRKYNFSINELLNHLLLAASLQSVLSLIAYIFPTIQNFFISNLISYGYNPSFQYLSEFRMYGFSSSLNYSTPIIQGVFFVISIFMALNYNFKYIFYSPFLIFSAIINARSSIIVVFLGILTILFTHNYFNLTKTKKLLSYFLSVLLLSVIGVNFIRSFSPENFKFILEGIQDIRMVFLGDIKPGSYFYYIKDPSRYILPTGYSLFFGKGTIDLPKFNLQSDVGWTNDIWLGGIFYSILFYSLFLKILYEILIFDKTNSFYKFFTIFLFFVLLASNFKGFIFGVNEVTTLIFIIYSFTLIPISRKYSNSV